MGNKLTSRMTYANAAGTIALVIAVGGGGVAVAAGKVPARSVGTKQIVNGAIRAVDLHGGAVTAPKIRKGAVAAPKIRKGAVTGLKVKDGTISSADIQDGGINEPRMFGSGNLGVVRAYAFNESPQTDVDLTGMPSTFNASGGAVTVDRISTGTYKVEFAGMDLVGTVALVSSNSTVFPAWCTTEGWAEDTVSVRCLNSVGALADVAFTVAVID